MDAQAKHRYVEPGGCGYFPIGDLADIFLMIEEIYSSKLLRRNTIFPKNAGTEPQHDILIGTAAGFDAERLIYACLLMAPQILST